MGGGEGSTAREILRHKTVEKVIMCDIDEVKLPKFLIYIFVCVLCVLTQYFLLRLFGFTRSYVLFVFSSFSLFRIFLFSFS